MVYRNTYNKPSGRRNFEKRDFNSGDRQMHNAVCSTCGKDCQVPFMPSGNKPVFCSDCFEKNRGGSEGRRFNNDRNFSRPRFDDRSPRPPQPQNNEQLNIVNEKLDKILAILTPLQSLTLPAEAPVEVVEKKKSSKKIVSPPEA